jgi:hypothetical protein
VGPASTNRYPYGGLGSPAFFGPGFY